MDRHALREVLKMIAGWKLTSVALAGALGIAVLAYWRTDLVKAAVQDLGARFGGRGSNSARRKLVFKPDAHAIISNRDGFEVGVFGFTSSDGNEVSYYLLTPVGTASAANEFDKRLAQADYVVVREPFKNPEGRAEERAVIFFENPRNHREVAAVLWTDGPRLRSIESGSLYDVLEFEKRGPH